MNFLNFRNKKQTFLLICAIYCFSDVEKEPPMLHGHGHGHDTDTDTRIWQFLKNKDTTWRGHGG